MSLLRFAQVTKYFLDYKTDYAKWSEELISLSEEIGREKRSE